MEYVPRYIHEKYQQFHYYEMLNDFTIAVLDNARYVDLNNRNDWDDLTYDLDLEIGDIICVRFFKSDQRYDSVCYAYLDFYIRNNERFDINQETILSKEMIDLNSFIFDDVTSQYKRNLKIENILNEGDK
jgi:hypothetical protein